MPFDLTRKKILLVRNDNIGDAILSTPVLEAIKKLYPTCFVAVLCAGYSREAFEQNPYIDRLFVYEKAKHHSGAAKKLFAWLGHFQTMLAVRAQGFDFCVGLRSSFSRSNGSLVYWSGAKTKVVRLSQKISDMAKFDAFIDEDACGKHEVQNTFDCLKLFGIENAGERPVFVVDDEVKDKIEAVLNALDFENFVTFHISSRLGQNRYGIEKWLRLAGQIASDMGLKVAVTAAPQSPESTAAAKLFCSKNIRFFQTENLQELAALIASSRCFVSTDGGAMHLGAAAAVPVVALFGKTNASTWRPYTPSCVLLQPQSKQAKDIDVAQVMQAVRELCG